MEIKNNLSWLGILKILPISIGLLSGILGVIQQVINLYWPNPSAFWQARLFWTFVWIAFFGSFVIAWLQEHAQVRKLKASLLETSPKLLFHAKDVYLVKPSGWDDFGTHFITIDLSVTNFRVQPNTITNCHLRVETEGGILIGEIVEDAYVKTGRKEPHSILIKRPADEPIFLQGVPQRFSRTFKFSLDDSIFSLEKPLEDAPVLITLTDSYGTEYKVSARTSATLTKDVLFVDPNSGGIFI